MRNTFFPFWKQNNPIEIDTFTLLQGFYHSHLCYYSLSTQIFLIIFNAYDSYLFSTYFSFLGSTVSRWGYFSQSKAQKYMGWQKGECCNGYHKHNLIHNVSTFFNRKPKNYKMEGRDKSFYMQYICGTYLALIK